MDNNLYKNLLQESYIIDIFSIRHGSSLMELDTSNMDIDVAKRKVIKAMPIIEKTLKKYKINVNDIKKLAKQTGSKFVNDLKLDKIKNKEKRKEKVINEAKKIISKKFNIDKIKAAVDLDNDEDKTEEAFGFSNRPLIVVIIYNLLLASYLGHVLLSGVTHPVVILTFAMIILINLWAARVVIKNR